ncbi:MAG: YhjD/YihY/BrkB family envelope integrity protein [Acidobacteriota bacterium]|nr:YhjD/YihY/BrkB family envelope integrity protein [Acidobacteriota bacterium]
MKRPNDRRQKIRRRAAPAWDLLVDAVGRFSRNGDGNQAAAIALYAILSLIPLFILSILVISRFFGANPEVQQEVLDGIHAVHPFLSDELMAQLGVIEEKRQVLGWAGLVSLLWFASMIFGVVEKALDIVFRSPTERSYLKSKILAMAMIPAAWAAGIASVVLTSLAVRLTELPWVRALWPPGFDFLRGIVFGYMVPFFLVVLIAAVGYRIIPTRKIRMARVFTGAAVFAVLMEAAKHFFTWYIARHTRYSVIFGSLETVVILVIWVFYVALIFLFCAELIAAFERRHLVLLEKSMLGHKAPAAGIEDRLYAKFGCLYPRGAYLFREGDAGREIFHILSGRVRVEKESAPAKKFLTEIGPGEYIGEMAALTGTPRTASAVAVEDSRIAVIDERTFRDLLRESEHIAVLMLKEFSRRLKNTNDSLDELNQTRTRLLALLILAADQPFEKGREPTVAGIAALTGEDADDLRQVMAGLVEEGWLTLKDGKVTAIKMDAIREAVRSREFPA